MKIKFKGRVTHPTAFALARNMGLLLMRGWNEVESKKARELLKLYPAAFEKEKDKPKPLPVTPLPVVVDNEGED